MSTDAARRALEAQLGASVPKGVCALSETELGDLAEAVQSARRRQTLSLAEAGERALNRIPRLLRGPVRKIVGA
ncbi:MAG: hypothetical protein ACM3UX_00900 [Candidatus Woesearchaeota archaeon]